MLEIGETLRETREENGVSIEEAAEDLNIRPTLLKSLEEGNIDGFDDIFYVKNFIGEYAKYLGLDVTKTLDEFNEYLFEKTSRIPLDKIKELNVDKNIKEEKPISSPYTTSVKVSKKISYKKIIVAFGILILLVIGFFIVRAIRNDEYNSTETVYLYD